MYAYGYGYGPFLHAINGCIAPGTPTGLTATEASSTRINLAWTAPAGSVTGYKIERSVDDGTWATVVADTGNTITNYADTSVSAGTINTYRVCAINGACVSSASATAEDYAFANASARTGYSAVVTANGGAIDYSIYDTAPRTVKVKEALDNLFVAGNSDGWLTKMKASSLFFGGTANTHAVNIFNAGTYNLTFVNSPTQSKSGMVLNGTSQYARNGFIESANGTLNDVSVGVKTSGVTATGTDAYIGASNSTSIRIQIIHQTSAAFQFNSYTATDGAGRLGASATRNTFLVGSRRASNDYEIYQNGVSLASATDSGGTRPSFEYFIGALNNAGSPLNYVDGTIYFYYNGLGLTDAEVLSLHNQVTAFNLILGR
jgi:hypothetical protein